MEKDIVSVITPCYNAGKYIYRLLDSILAQDYPHIAMFVMDDGSTDNSREVITSYIPKFEERGYSLKYRYQENSGQSVAINNALKWVDGEFLVWPDSDDWYSSPKAISKMVEECRKSSNVGLVRCLNHEYNEDLKLIGSTIITEDIAKNDQFDNCVFSEGGFYYCPGEYMVRMDVLDEAIPNREIYTERIAGQNWQLMLPVLYQRDCVTIPEFMYAILARHDSHCRGQNSYEKSSAVLYGYIHQLHSTLDNIANIPNEKREEYKKKVEIQYLKEIFIQAVVYGKKAEARQILERLDSLGDLAIGRQWMLRYHFCQYAWFRGLIKVLGRIR